jgi:hypothetical protein
MAPGTSGACAQVGDVEPLQDRDAAPIDLGDQPRDYGAAGVVVDEEGAAVALILFDPS